MTFEIRDTEVEALVDSRLLDLAHRTNQGATSQWHLVGCSIVWPWHGGSRRRNPEAGRHAQPEPLLLKKVEDYSQRRGSSALPAPARAGLSKFNPAQACPKRFNAVSVRPMALNKATKLAKQTRKIRRNRRAAWEVQEPAVGQPL